ncbi:uncharacterized protein EV420DRAFT_1562358 [Desarmillaria tabescens]|uniref:Uncharacterized protein n=1 Tax=Armillaria tabescens TaxID=1929756 RepID=A0AA39MY75_ARMTA|nr:uncharacterized protein EV420DRAFT_1562358 [Desarmillaria tabescens]KAK0450558.1 hypothetical protein EV420DRAFT_1562358 [Desarmillaria tabescens]
MLPNELLDAIIEECRDDRETLMACSLVNRTLRWSSQKRLFAEITLSSSHCYATHAAPYPSLLRLVSSSSMIASYVKSLRIHDSDKEIIPRILEQLPNIESLSIAWTSLDFIGNALKCALSQPQLQKISFDGIMFKTSEEFFELFAHSTEIRSVQFSDSCIQTTLPSSMAPFQRCTILDLSLRTGEGETNRFVDGVLGISSTIDVGHLTRLQFWMTTTAYLPALLKLLATTKGTLDELDLDLLALATPRQGELDVSGVPRVKCVLRCSVYAQPVLACVSSIFGGTSSATLEEAELVLRVSDAKPFGASDDALWSDADSVMVRVKRRVSVCIEFLQPEQRDRYGDTCVGLFREKMARCRDKGILHVDSKVVAPY